MKKTLTFTVEGAYITQTARTLLADGKYQSAFELVKNATITDDLSPIEHDHLIFDILRGRFDLVGTYPHDDYGLEEVASHPDYIQEAFDTIIQKQTAVENDLKDMQEKWDWFIEALEDENPYLLKSLMLRYQRKSDHSGLKPAATSNILYRPGITSEYLDTQNLLSDYLETQKRNDDAEYGWLEPNGTFHPLPWGEHEKWASEYLEEHFPYETCPDMYFHVFPEQGRKHIVNGDVLAYKLGWILINNPLQGQGQISLIGKPMTTQQKDFLDRYYRERGNDKKANALWTDK